MKPWIPLLLVAGCAANRVTHYRGGWGSCHAADPNVIECGGKQVAQVECYQPAEEACGALAVLYADGERVFLVRPLGFEPGQEDSLQPGAVLRPELASDGSMIWYRTAIGRKDSWTVYEPQTGITREVDTFRIFQIRERDPHSMPLWAAHPAAAQ
jgi:hypothetical protein